MFSKPSLNIVGLLTILLDSISIYLFGYGILYDYLFIETIIYGILISSDSFIVLMRLLLMVTFFPYSFYEEMVFKQRALR